MSALTLPAPTALRGGPRQRPRRRAGALWGVVAWVAGVLFFLPVGWMVLTSFHSEQDAATNPPSFAAPLTLDGYREFFGASSGASPWPPLINSATASIVSTIVVIVLAIPVAYALSVKPVEKWTDVMKQHAAGSGIAFLWEQQLLNTPVPSTAG